MRKGFPRAFSVHTENAGRVKADHNRTVQGKTDAET
jgi:hypothetical protein